MHHKLLVVTIFLSFLVKIKNFFFTVVTDNFPYSEQL